jgi:hypothetical protein
MVIIFSEIPFLQRMENNYQGFIRLTAPSSAQALLQEGYGENLVFETHKNTPEILAVLVNAMIKNSNIFLVKKTEYFLFELPAPFAGDDLDKVDFLFDRFLNDAIKFRFYFVAAIVDVV